MTEFEVPEIATPDDLAYCFARWLNLYFYPWNPDDGTWIDANNKTFTTEELLNEFKQK